jgi:zinc transporter, ZIP family
LEEFIRIIIYTTAAGACIPLGGLIARFEHIRPNWLENELRHFVTAFGGGILIGAVAIVLVPEGETYLNNSILVVPILIAGGVVFFLVERFLGRHQHEAPQLIAMLLDYIPESLALGGLIASGSATAPLLAILIGLQNFPEGFNAFRELDVLNNHRPKQTLKIMWALVVMGPFFGIIGWAFCAEYHYLLGAVMLFASGGILYLIFQDIAPQSKLKRHWAPPLGAVIGFGLALLGQLVVGHV